MFPVSLGLEVLTVKKWWLSPVRELLLNLWSSEHTVSIPTICLQPSRQHEQWGFCDPTSSSQIKCSLVLHYLGTVLKKEKKKLQLFRYVSTSNPTERGNAQERVSSFCWRNTLRATSKRVLHMYIPSRKKPENIKDILNYFVVNG